MIGQIKGRTATRTLYLMDREVLGVNINYDIKYRMGEELEESD